MAECNGCTKCCEALHLNRWGAERIFDPERVDRIMDGPLMRSLFIKISRRRAKKINPYMFTRPVNKTEAKFLKTAQFFKCKALEVGVGCTIHASRPATCRDYDGGLEYTDNCAQLIPVNNI